mmetsp:Transcript_101948/g.314650  ORF Transcript_101948/g.314650 Transcript_101948/m.314650 type:complete len:229 (-) Transcript_101948:196-882(-)
MFDTSTLKGVSHDAHLPEMDRLANSAMLSLATAVACATFWTMSRRFSWSAFCCKALSMLACSTSSHFRTSSRRSSRAECKLFLETMGPWSRLARWTGDLEPEEPREVGEGLSSTASSSRRSGSPAGSRISPLASSCWIWEPTELPVLPILRCTRASCSMPDTRPVRSPILPCACSKSRCRPLMAVVRFSSSRRMSAAWLSTCSCSRSLCKSRANSGSMGGHDAPKSRR